MKYFVLLFAAAIISFGCSDKKSDDSVTSIETNEVTYTANGTTLKGFIAYNKSIEDKMPGVLVVHEWWGHNEYARKRAKMLAELGYIALAVDMYGDGKKADHPDDAGKFAMAVMQDMPTAASRFNAGLNYLKQHSQSDPDKIAAIGYCFGGGIVLRMGINGADLNGVVSFHGSLPTDSIPEPGKVESKFLVLNGAADPMVTDEQIETFKQVMNEAGLEYNLVNYPGALHSFTNPAADSIGKLYELPLAYSKEADQRSWDEMKMFLQMVFQ